MKPQFGESNHLKQIEVECLQVEVCWNANDMYPKDSVIAWQAEKEG